MGSQRSAGCRPGEIWGPYAMCPRWKEISRRAPPGFDAHHHKSRWFWPSTHYAPIPHPFRNMKTIPSTDISPLPALALFGCSFRLLSGHCPEPRGLPGQSNLVKHSPSLAGFEWKSTEWKRHVFRGQSGKVRKKAGEERSIKFFSPPIPHLPLTGYKAVGTAGGVEFSGCLSGSSKAGGREPSCKMRSNPETLLWSSLHTVFLFSH